MPRAEIRQAKAKPIFEDLERWLAAQLPAISGKSPLATAIRYALARMKRLRPYLEHGILELDNNTAERSMRAVALGRKNYLFIGSEAGGKAAAIAYTLIETAKLNGVDPQAWLADTLARLPDHKITRIDELPPMEMGQLMSILRLTAVLEDVKPRVSRTLMVPADLRLDRLHLVLQVAMGWENQHLYSFDAGPLRWILPDPHLGLDALPANKAILQDALAAAGNGPRVYTYDFGDDWRHRLTAEPTDGPLPGQLYPRLVEAEGRCPPEDVGGPPGYEHFLQAIADPGHPDHDELTEWHDEPFDPSVPDTNTHQLEVLKLAKRWQPRKK